MSTPDSSRPSGDVSPVQVIEALLFLPIGLGATVVGRAPERLNQARSDLAAARFIGEMAVNQGAAMLRERLAERRTIDAGGDTLVDDSPERDDGAAESRDEDDDGEVVVVDTDAAAGEVAPTVDALAIPDYDTVPAIDVVAQLADLDAGERALIEAYESAHRGRRTVLGKIEQLRDEP